MAVSVASDQVRRLCLNERIFKACETSRTHFHSHPDLQNLAVGPHLVADFQHAMAKDMATLTAQCIDEWLTPRFPFFVEIHGTRLLSTACRVATGCFLSKVVCKFGLVPSSVLVLGWEGDMTEIGLRVRYVFEDVIVDRYRAFTIYSYIRYEALRERNEALRRSLLGDKRDEDWVNVVPSSPYVSEASNGGKALTMLGSFAMRKCPEKEEFVGKMHKNCPHCLGSRRVPISNSIPFSLLHVLDADGNESEDPKKLDKLDAIRRTTLRTDLVMSDSYKEPNDAPAVPVLDTNKKRGLVLAPHDEFVKGAETETSGVRVEDTQKLLVLQAIVRRHAPQYSELHVRHAECYGGKDKYYRVFVKGFNDLCCINVGHRHNADVESQAKGWAGRIGFRVSASAVQMTCHCSEPIDPMSGQTPCLGYVQRPIDHKKPSMDENRILRLFNKPLRGGSGPIGHQLTHDYLLTMYEQLHANNPPKRQRTL